jgi:branched-chain amino acid transport system permease protein
VLSNLRRSREVRVFRAVRDDEAAAQLSGLDVARIQVTAFVLSAACAGLAGGLLAVITQLAAPGAFDLSLSLALLTGIVLGGLGSLTGALWGAIVLVMLPSWSDDIAGQLSLSTDVKSNLPLALYGIVLMGVIVAAPEGIQGALRRLGRRLGVRRPSVPREEGA